MPDIGYSGGAYGVDDYEGFTGDIVYGTGLYGVGDYEGGSPLEIVVQNTYPNSVQLIATELVAGQSVTIYRVVQGSTVRTPIRGVDSIVATSDTMVRVDAEAPFGVQLTYILSVDDVDIAAPTVTLSLAKVALSDAITGNAAEVVILSWPTKRRERPSSVFPIGGRNIVVSGQRGGWTGTIDVFVETDEAKNNVLNLLDTATSGILQLRSDRSKTSDGVDAYISVLSDDENRYSQDGSDERRVISLDVVESTPWASSKESSTFTLQSIADAYPGGTLASIAADYGTLLALAIGDFS